MREGRIMSKSETKVKKRRIKFLLDLPQAHTVSLVGDFNRWKDGVHPMKRNRNGIWEKIVMLTPGSYEYKFFVEGRWLNDPGNNQSCTNSFGTLNNIINVSAK
jgi:1,4-alpha-glucan branching enzyme